MTEFACTLAGRDPLCCKIHMFHLFDGSHLLPNRFSDARHTGWACVHPLHHAIMRDGCFDPHTASGQDTGAYQDMPIYPECSTIFAFANSQFDSVDVTSLKSLIFFFFSFSCIDRLRSQHTIAFLIQGFATIPLVDRLVLVVI